MLEWTSGVVSYIRICQSKEGFVSAFKLRADCRALLLLEPGAWGQQMCGCKKNERVHAICPRDECRKWNFEIGKIIKYKFSGVWTRSFISSKICVILGRVDVLYTFLLSICKLVPSEVREMNHCNKMLETILRPAQADLKGSQNYKVVY